MPTILRQSFHKARKTYKCDASIRWLSSGLSLEDCKDDSQRSTIKEAEKDNWEIRSGTQYIKVAVVKDRHIFTVRYRPGMFEVCKDLGL